MKNRWVKVIIKYVLITATMILGFSASLYIVCRFCSETLIRDNVRRSVSVLTAEGVYPNYNGEGTDAGQDNFTDSLMLNINYNIESEQAWQSAMAMTYTKPQEEFIGIDALQSLEDNEIKVKYARYWHGYMVFLRPLLTITDYAGIRQIQKIVLGVLCVLTCLIICKYLGILRTLPLLLGFLAIKVWRIPLSIQYMGTTMLMLILICIIIYIYQNEKRRRYLVCLFYIAGGCTSFIDLLTTPIIVMGVPVIYLLFCMEKTEDKNIQNITKEIVGCICAWGLGYAMIWASKWVLASLSLGENIIQNAVAQSQEYLGQGTGGEGAVMQALKKNIYYLLDNDSKVVLFGGICLSVAIIIGGYLKRDYAFERKKDTVYFLCCFIVLAFSPYLWYCVLGNHSAIHAYFTYRAQIVTVVAFAASVEYISGLSGGCKRSMKRSGEK